jgi:Mrp family chromosome partitioning ATPase
VDNLEWPRTIDRLFEEHPERFDSLVTHLVQLADGGSKRIAVVACTPGAGGTTLTLCLARRLSDVVEKVALVDGNFATPRLGAELDVSLEAGWEDVLAGKQAAEEAAVTAIENRITLLPVMTPSAVSYDGASAKRATLVLQKLAVSHDIVLLDAGLAAASGQASVIGGDDEPAVDGAILVRDVRRCSEQHLRAVVDDLAAHGVAAVAVAENFESAAVADRSRAAA